MKSHKERGFQLANLFCQVQKQTGLNSSIDIYNFLLEKALVGGKLGFRRYHRLHLFLVLVAVLDDLSSCRFSL
jgi:hypothetical protein